MIGFREGEIKNILPINLITPEVQALSYSIGNAMKDMVKFSASAHLYSDLENVPEEALDLIAMELNTQYYVQMLPRDTKESLIRQTLQWYMHGGTPSVLEQFLSTILDGGRIDEWYQYGGEPYFFRAYVYAGEHQMELGYGTEVKRQIEKYKNVRSWIDWVAFVISSIVSVKIEYGNAIHFQNIFHPRKNITYIKLDGKWRLDGHKRLSGYDDDMEVDFCPAKLSLNITTAVDKKDEEHICIRAEIRPNEKTIERATYCIKTEQQANRKEKLSMRFCVSEDLSPGDIGITTIRKLDGAWKLDGNRKLNGGYCAI